MILVKTPLRGRTTRMATLALMLLAACLEMAADTYYGVTKEIVIKELGEPRSIIGKGNREYLMYSNSVRVELKDGILFDHRNLSERKIKKFKSIAAKFRPKPVVKKKPPPKPVEPEPAPSIEAEATAPPIALNQQEAEPNLTSSPTATPSLPTGNALNVALVYLVGAIFFGFFLIACIVTIVRSKHRKRLSDRMVEETKPETIATEESKAEPAETSEDENKPTLVLLSQRKIEEPDSPTESIDEAQECNEEEKGELSDDEVDESVEIETEIEEETELPEHDPVFDGDQQLVAIQGIEDLALNQEIGATLASEEAAESEFETGLYQENDDQLLIDFTKEDATEPSLTEGEEVETEPEAISEETEDEREFESADEQPADLSETPQSFIEDYLEEEEEALIELEEKSPDSIDETIDEECIEEAVTEMIEVSAEEAISVIDEAVSQNESEPEELGSEEIGPSIAETEEVETASRHDSPAVDHEGVPAPETKQKLSLSITPKNYSGESDSGPAKKPLNPQPKKDDAPDFPRPAGLPAPSPYSQGARKKLSIRGKKN